jgi:hypothetical protein
MRFNKPFDFVNLRMNKVAEVIPTLDRERRHFVWLDYDCPLDSSVLEDIIGLFHVLALGSIVVVTVDAEPRLADDDEAESMTKDQLVARRIVEITDELGKYYEGVVGRRIFTPNALPAFYAQVLRNHFAEQISKRDSRDNAGFLQLFNFRYADGAQMLSLGGLIDDRNRLRGVRESRLFELGFIHENVDPIPISVPHLTVREKQYLDKCSSRKGMPFELQKEMFDNFRKYRRHYPTYYETLI